MNLIDCHCHLTDPKFSDLARTLQQATIAGVRQLIVPGTESRDWPAVIELTEKYPQVFGLLGVYPGNVETSGDLLATIDKLRQLCCENKKIVGIGEIGMDTYWNRRGVERQAEFFAAQLQLAVELDLPVAVHSRGAAPEIRAVFESQPKLPAGQFHCYGEDTEFLEYILGKGFYVSYCGNITYKSADHLRQLALTTPLERLLLETDSPYLPPEGKRGEVNEPANVKITAEFIAKLKGITVNELVVQTSANCQKLFKLNETYPQSNP